VTADLQDILVDIMSLTGLLNGSGGHGTKLDGHTFHDILILIGYRLIRISPLCGLRPASPLQNVFYLGLTAFMATFLLALGRKLPEFPLLSILARSAVQGYPRDEDEESQEVILWILFIGRDSIFMQPDDAWLIPTVTGTILALGLHTWEDVRRTLSKFPWVNALHDKPGQALWHRSSQIPH
jgi:hypothetical protein